MRIALTLDRDAGSGEENDYIRSLIEAGFDRSEIDLLSPGSVRPDEIDGVVLGGGCDVDPARYGQARRQDAKLELDAERDATDFHLFDWAWRESVPIFGICRGVQVINVALGGTLVQDLPTQRPSAVLHQRPPRRRTRLDHEVSILPDSRLAKIAGRDRVEVNSRHHQAILDLAPQLRVSAMASDGLVEAAETTRPDRWLLGVQWHPENLADAVSKALFAEFATAARQRAEAGISQRARLLSRA